MLDNYITGIPCQFSYKLFDIWLRLAKCIEDFLGAKHCNEMVEVPR